MCGIVGIFHKNKSLNRNLGSMLAAMLVEMSERGPDSAGVAIYGRDVGASNTKQTLFSADPGFDWEGLCERLALLSGLEPELQIRASHAVVTTDVTRREFRSWLGQHYPELRIMSAGRAIEIYKEKGEPREFVERFKLHEFEGSHALGHTRMATESAVTTEHSHPFSTGMDLCLVHNGSLSNHNRLRERLQRKGVEFQTDNDSEVAAGYLTLRLREGASLDEALEAAIKDLDGFYTFAVGTRDGFAVLRDPIACKHAVLAETDDWVAMATEYRAIAVLPGAEKAKIWEPAPGQIYSWSRA